MDNSHSGTSKILPSLLKKKSPCSFFPLLENKFVHIELSNEQIIFFIKLILTISLKSKTCFVLKICKQIGYFMHTKSHDETIISFFQKKFRRIHNYATLL